MYIKCHWLTDSLLNIYIYSDPIRPVRTDSETFDIRSYHIIFQMSWSNYLYIDIYSNTYDIHRWQINCKRDVNCGLRMKKSNYCWHDSDDIYLHTRAKQRINTEVVFSWGPPPQRTGHWPHSPDRNPEDLCRWKQKLLQDSCYSHL